MSIEAVGSPRGRSSPAFASQVSTSEGIVVSGSIPQTSPPSPPVQACLDQADVAGQVKKEAIVIAQKERNLGFLWGAVRKIENGPRDPQLLGEIEAYLKEYGASAVALCLRFVSESNAGDPQRAKQLIYEGVVQNVLESWSSIDDLMMCVKDFKNKNERLKGLISEVVGGSLQGHKHFDDFLASCIKHIRSGSLDLVPFLVRVRVSFNKEESQEIYAKVMQGLSEVERTALLRAKPGWDYQETRDQLSRLLAFLLPADKKKYFESLFKNLPCDNFLGAFLSLRSKQIKCVAALFSEDPSYLISIWDNLLSSGWEVWKISEGIRCILLVILNLDDSMRGKAIYQLVERIRTASNKGRYVFVNIINPLLEDHHESCIVEKVQFLHLIFRSLKNELNDEGYIGSFRYARYVGYIAYGYDLDPRRERASRVGLLINALFYDDSKIDLTSMKCLETILDLNGGQEVQFVDRGAIYTMPSGKEKGRIIKMLSACEFKLLKRIVQKLKDCPEGEGSGMRQLLPSILSSRQISSALSEDESDGKLFEEVASQVRREESLSYRIRSGARRFFSLLSKVFRWFQR